MEGGGTIKSKTLLIVLIILIIVGIVLLINIVPLQKWFGKTPTPTPIPQAVQITPYKEEFTFRYTSTGFSPTTYTAKPGEVITFINDSKEEIGLNSADYPTHLKYPELNFGNLPAGTTARVVLNKAGTYEFINHFHPSHTGIIIVK